MIFRNHYNILIYCSRNISDYHQGWKQLWNVPDKNPTRCMVTLFLEDCVSLFLHLCSSSHPDSLHTARHPKNKTLNIITPDSDTRCMESFYMKDKYCLHFLRCGQTQPSKRALCNSLDSVVGSESVSSPSYLYNGENNVCMFTGSCTTNHLTLFPSQLLECLSFAHVQYLKSSAQLYSLYFLFFSLAYV